jgi:hypothetical protein
VAVARRSAPPARFGAPSSAQIPWAPVAAGFPRTAAELNGFSAHTRHLEMWDYLRSLRGATREMRLASYGRHGRDASCRTRSSAVRSSPSPGRPGRSAGPSWCWARTCTGTSAASARACSSSCAIWRRPARRPTRCSTRSRSSSRRSSTPTASRRARGQRGNSWGIDLNRDYVKLEHPAIANLVANVLGAWRPHVFVDGHDGGSRPYNVNYQCPSHYDPCGSSR